MNINIDFSRNLIKGRIAETIFEEMFKVEEKFTILRLGYEHTLPELAQYQHHVHVQKVLENIRNTPDFALISQDKSQVYLVEVKYRKHIDNSRVLEIANELFRRWEMCNLFIVTEKHFYYDTCENVITNKGCMSLLSEEVIKYSCQEQFLTALLNPRCVSSWDGGAPRFDSCGANSYAV